MPHQNTCKVGTKDNFTWNPNAPPPPIEGHSRAKLRVLSAYLRKYFDKLTIDRRRDEFKLDLIDGFSGGGTYSYDNEVISGSPIIMLEEFDKAKNRLNQNRRKPLRIDVKHYFVDKEQHHCEHLRKVIKERGYDDETKYNIKILDRPFEEVEDDIIKEVKRRQPRAERAIFLLDQCGYSDVSLETINRIFEELKNAEIILTIAADALINTRNVDLGQNNVLAPIRAKIQQAGEENLRKEGEYSKAYIQRSLKEKLIKSILPDSQTTPYFTPFFIRPPTSHRALWFIHLSRHLTARDVMMQIHWGERNTFEHYGPGDLGMLGWEGMNSGILPVFNFSKDDINAVWNSLIEKFPAFLSEQRGPIVNHEIRNTLANETTARHSDIDGILLELRNMGEVEILDYKSMKPRTYPSLKRLNPQDIITRKKQIIISTMRRYNRS